MAIRGPGHTLVKILSLLLFLSVSAGLYFPIQKFAEIRTSEAKREIIDFLEARIKRKISYESISPSIFRYVEIRNLSLTDSRGGRLTTVKKLRVHYDVFSLLRGRGGPEISEISVENSTLDFDLRRDRDLVDFFFGKTGSESGEEAQSDPAPSIIRKVKITGRNLNLIIRSDEGELTADKLFLVLQPGKDAASIRLRGGLSYKAVNEGALLRWGQTTMDLRGQVGNSFERSEVQVSFSRFTSNVLDARRQTFRVVYDGESLAVRKVQDNSPYDAGLVFHFPTRTLKGDFLSSGLVPSSVVVFKDSFSFLNDWLGTVLTARGNAAWESSSGRLVYGLDFDATVKNSMVTHETRLSGRADGDETVLRFSPLHAVGKFGDFTFSGALDLASFLPEGGLKVARLDLPGIPRLSGEVGLKKSGAVIAFFGSRIDVGRQTIFSPEGRFLWKKGFILASMDFSLDESGLSSVRTDFSLPLAKMSPLSFGADFTAVPASRILSMIEEVSPDVGQNLSRLRGREFMIEGSLSGETDYVSLKIDCPALTAKEAETGNFIDASGSFDRGRIDIPKWSFLWDSVPGRGSLRGDLSRDGRLTFASGLSVLDVPYEVSGLIDPKGYLRLKGLYGLEAELRWREHGPLFGDIALEDLPLPVLGKDVRLKASTGINFEDISSWSVNVKSLTLSGLRLFPATASTVELAGTFGPFGGNLARVKYHDRYSSLTGGGALRYEYPAIAVDGELNLTDAEGKERYGLNFSVKGQRGSGFLGFSGAPMERFGLPEISGRLSGSAAFTGLPDIPDVRLSLKLSDATLAEAPLAASLTGKYQGNVITVETSSLRYQHFQVTDAKGRLDLERGMLDLESGFSYRLSVKPVEWRVGVRARFEPDRRIERLPDLALGDWWGSLEAETADESIDPLFRGWKIDLKRNGQMTEFRGGPGDGVKGVFRDSGEFEFGAQEPLPVTFDASGVISPTRIEADINKISFKAEKLQKLLDLKVVKFLRGQANGNIRIVGPIRDPDFFGAVTAAQVYAKVEIIPEELGPCRGNLIFREKELVLQPMLVPVEGGTAEVSASFLIDQWVPETYAVDIDTKSSGAVHVKYAFGPANLNGFGQGKISIVGDLQTAKVSGKITASSTIITIADINNMNAAAQQSAPQMDTAIILDLNIESGKAVEFFWPNTDFPILRTYADIGQKLSIRLDSRSTDFRVVGDIKIIGGEVYYFDRSFYLREGMIRFDERKELFDPTLTARAEIRESTDDGLVRIYLVADNTKLSQFFPRFESDSALTNPEILAILGKNVFTGESTDSVNFSTALLFTSDILSQIGLVREFERDMRSRLNLDLFSFRTHIVQNVLQEAVNQSETTATTNTTDYNDVSFGRYLDKTSVFLGKYLSKDIFLELMMQFYARDPLEQRRRDFGGMEIESEIMLEWKTPFFLLEWTLSPSNPEELFVRDMTFAFKWKFSF